MPEGFDSPWGSNPQDLPPIAALWTVVVQGFDSPRLAAYSGYPGVVDMLALFWFITFYSIGGAEDPHPIPTPPPVARRDGTLWVWVGRWRVGPLGGGLPCLLAAQPGGRSSPVGVATRWLRHVPGALTSTWFRSSCVGWE